MFGAVVALGLITVFVILVLWAERRFIARLQDRWGPNRVGKFGLLQSVADALKLLSKEIIVPGQADALLHFAGAVAGAGRRRSWSGRSFPGARACRSPT